MLTATRHTLNFNALSFDKFEDLCFWLVEDSGEYKLVEHYGGAGDKNRDIIGYTFDDELDYFQCKRYEDPTYAVLKKELDGILEHVTTEEIKKPRRIYFVLSSSVSPDAKDKLKDYAESINLPVPAFWEPVILDKKVKKNPEALENFFGITNKNEEEHLPQVDITGLVAYGTHEYRFTIVNHADVPAIDCSWSLVGFAWPGYPGVPTVFDLGPHEKKELVIAMEGQFMKQNAIRELKARFKFRDNKNNWFYSERVLIPEKAPSDAFYRIKAEAGEYIPARPLPKFTIDQIEAMDRTGLNQTRLVSYTCNGMSRYLKINISSTLAAIWQFSPDELEGAFKELAEMKIMQMMKNGRFEDDFSVTTYLKETRTNGFEAYQELRDSIE